jgi:hypothetical protein
VRLLPEVAELEVPRPQVVRLVQGTSALKPVPAGETMSRDDFERRLRDGLRVVESARDGDL